jgi:hypothetical protein
VERVRNRVEADQARGTYLDVDARRVTFAVFAAEWVATRTFNLSTHEATELRLPLHVLPLTGGWSCDKSPVHHQKLPGPIDLSDTCKRVTLVKGLGRPRTAVDGERSKDLCRGCCPKAHRDGRLLRHAFHPSALANGAPTGCVLTTDPKGERSW